jgi:hypothetical protein
MKGVICFFILVGSISTGICQRSPGPGIKNLAGYNTTNMLYSNGSYMAEKGPDVEGNPYLYEEWLTGNIVLEGGEQFDSLLLRLVLVNNELQLKMDNKEYKFNVIVKEFLLTAPGKELRKFKSGAAFDKPVNDKSFYEVLYEGKTQLLVKRKKQIVSEVTNIPGLKTKKYEENNSYFVYLPSGQIERIKKNNKSLINLLGDRKHNVEEVIEKQHLDCTKEADIVKLLQYYDTI